LILVFGGVYQGKLDYALKHFELSLDQVYFCTERDSTLPTGKKIVYEVDKWLMALIMNGLDVSDAGKKLIEANPEAVIICNDVSCGIVPVQENERKWRELVGRVMSELAKASSQAVRLFCGLPMRLK